MKIYLILALIASVLGGVAWHKHVVAQRNDAQAQVKLLGERLKGANDAVAASEKLRGAENAQAKADLADAAETCTARVAEARRAAGAVKKIVEKPRATDPVTHCPVPDIVPAGELRGALQPDPFR